MGDRAMVIVKGHAMLPAGVGLYTHSGGSCLHRDVRDALKKRWRWNDEGYLCRIIFDVMSEGLRDQETGLGIGSGFWCEDSHGGPIVVDVDTQRVSGRGLDHSFEDFIKLSDEDLDRFEDRARGIDEDG